MFVLLVLLWESVLLVKTEKNGGPCYFISTGSENDKEIRKNAATKKRKEKGKRKKLKETKEKRNAKKRWKE